MDVWVQCERMANLQAQKTHSGAINYLMQRLFTFEQLCEGTPAKTSILDAGKKNRNKEYKPLPEKIMKAIRSKYKFIFRLNTWIDEIIH